MRELFLQSKFKRSFKRIIRKNPQLEAKILAIFDVLAIDPFSPSLKTHKLQGELDGLWSCFVEYDCRIIYTFCQDTETQEDLIILIDVGSHDDVY